MDFRLDETIVWWTILGVAIVLAVVALIFVARAAREALKIKRRTAKYASLPIVAAVTAGEADIVRLTAAIARIADVRTRAEVAIATIRRGPISRDVVDSYASLRTAVDDFRELAG